MNETRQALLEKALVTVSYWRDKLGEVTDAEVEEQALISCNWRALIESERIVDRLEDAWDCLDEAIDSLRAVVIPESDPEFAGEGTVSDGEADF